MSTLRLVVWALLVSAMPLAAAATSCDPSDLLDNLREVEPDQLIGAIEWAPLATAPELPVTGRWSAWAPVATWGDVSGPFEAGTNFDMRAERDACGLAAGPDVRMYELIIGSPPQLVELRNGGTAPVSQARHLTELLGEAAPVPLPPTWASWWTAWSRFVGFAVVAGGAALAMVLAGLRRRSA